MFINKLKVTEQEASDAFHYFKGIKSHLEAHGFEVHHTDVDFAGSVERRAAQLGEQITQILAGRSSTKVHLVAHSMGGLDAWRIIVDIPGMADKVATLTTIGTPHAGTSFADFGLSLGGSLAIDALRPVIHLEGFEDLTIASCQSVNRRAREQEVRNAVRYQTSAPSEVRDWVFLPLQGSWSIINQREGENDGLVAVRSQQWEAKLVASNGNRKKVIQQRSPVPADHLNEIGWWDLEEMNPGGAVENPAKQATDYEDKIKAIYLDIARGG